MAFGIGDTVRWSSQAGGVRKEKVGEVVAVVAAKTLPNREQFLSLYKGAGIGISRDHESYVVRVRTGKTATKDYWPRSNSLSAVYPSSPVGEPLTAGQLLQKLTEVVGRPNLADARVALACHIGRTTLGPTPQVGVVGVHVGFDWDANTMFLEAAKPIGIAGAELEKLGQVADEQARFISQMRRALMGNQPAEHTVAEMKRLMQAHLAPRG